jgi:hypothetical protein
VGKGVGDGEGEELGVGLTVGVGLGVGVEVGIGVAVGVVHPISVNQSKQHPKKEKRRGVFVRVTISPFNA